MSEHHEGSDSGSEHDHRDADEQRRVHEPDSVLPVRRGRVWQWATFLAIVVIVAAAFVVPVPYYVDGPGTVRATQPLVSIAGHDSYESKGSLMFTTVSERRATPALLVQAWLDESIDALPKEVVNPTGNREQQRREEQLLMDRSKLTALTVAFDVLDLPIEITGTGAFINEVSRGYPASRTLNPGDVIVSVNGTPITVADDVRPVLATLPVGSEVELGLRRKGESGVDDVTVTLGANDEDPTRGFLGVMLTTADEDVDLGFDIDLDSGSVIGPSAGLAWTLGVIDRLTPGDLTGGRKVAVTGTISVGGVVGPIGGIAQKVVGAKRAGATVFLYPEATDRRDVARMRELADGDLRLHPVGTITDALRVLDPDGLGAAS